MAPEYLSAKEAAAELAVDVQVVYKLLRSGKLAGDRIGRCWRIERRSLWVASELDHNATIREVYDRLGRIEAKLDAVLAGGYSCGRRDGGAGLPSGGV